MGPRQNVLDMLRVGAAAVTAVALAAVLVSSAVLLLEYRPGGFPGSSNADRYQPHVWVLLHEAGLVVALVAVVVWAALTAAVVRVRTRGAIGVVVITTAFAVITCAVAAYSWFLVTWSELGLWAVTVGTDKRGWWTATNPDDVRFVFVGNTEVSPRAYLVALLVHLLATVAAALLLGVSMLWAARHRRDAGTTEPANDAAWVAY